LIDFVDIFTGCDEAGRSDWAGSTMAMFARAYFQVAPVIWSFTLFLRYDRRDHV
jgi:hypothetical protein